MLATEPIVTVTIEKPIADKLLDRDEITKSDIRTLNLYSDHHIDKLLAAGQSTVRHKLAEVLVRDGIMEVRA